MRLLFGHDRLRDQLSAYLDGELNARESERMVMHVGTCEECSQTLAELRATRDALNTLPAVGVPRSFTLRESQVAGPAKAQPKLLPLAWGAASAVAAFMLAFSLVGDFAFDSGSETQTASRAAQERDNSAPTISDPLRASSESQASGPQFDANAPPAAAQPEPQVSASASEGERNSWRTVEIAAGVSLAGLLLAGGAYTVANRRGSI